MTRQEIEACLAFLGRTTLNAQEIPAWNAVVLRLQELLKTTKPQAEDNPQLR